MKNSNKQIVGVLLATVILIFGFSSPARNYANLPKEINLIKGDHLEIQPFFPLVLHVSEQSEQVFAIDGSKNIDNSPISLNLTNTLELTSVEVGEVEVEFRLFGYIPLKSIEINVLEDRELIPGGEAIGIQAAAGEIVVADYYSVNSKETFSPAKRAGIRKGDSLTAINGREISDLDSAAEYLENEFAEMPNNKEKEVKVSIKRSGSKKVKTIEPEYCSELNDYSIGLFLTDSSLGVGTMTYKDAETGEYGALGHSITTWEQAPSNLQDAQIVDAKIIGINKATEGEPGKKRGTFVRNDQPLGTIEKNTRYGIFGNLLETDVLTNNFSPKSLGLIEHVDTGAASILTVVEDQQVQSFDIEITQLLPHNSRDGKGMVIEVTDEDLIDKTGGIVQGMSGSPIIQDNKIVGAVTHVFVSDAQKGYGIFLEWMIYESQK